MTGEWRFCEYGSALAAELVLAKGNDLSLSVAIAKTRAFLIHGFLLMRTYRVPLAGPYNTRVSAVNAPDSSSGYWGVGIWGTFIWGKSSQSTDKDARYINCFLETVPDQTSNKKRVYTVKRPGFGTQNTPASGKKGYAILVWTGSGSGTSVVSAFHSPSTIYVDSTSVGAITGKATGITETVIGTLPTLAVTSNDNSAWYYDTSVGVMTQITSVNFPGIAGKTITGTFAHLDGFACIATTDGGLYAGDLNSLTAWTANSFDSANAFPDQGIAAVRFKNFIMYFGTESVQFFYNAGLTPFPLAKAIAMTLKVGAISADAIATLSDNVFWAGSTPQGGLSIFQFNGVVSRISSPEVDAIIILAGPANISLTTIRFYGRSFVLVTAGATTKAYCIEEKFWYDWNSTTPLWYKVVGLSLGNTMVNYAVSNVATTGKVYVMNHASLVFTDDGTTYTARIQTPKDDYETNASKFFSYLDIVGDVETSSSPLTISASDDDYATYQVLGTVDLSSQQRRISRLGSARRRSWIFTHSANTPLRLERAEGQMKVGYQ